MDTSSRNLDWFGPDLPLARRFALYLPTKRRDGSPVDGFETVAKAGSDLLAKWFGGVTAFTATGTFVNVQGAAITEGVVILESFCDKDAWKQHGGDAHALAVILVQLLAQESIACLLDGNMVCVQATSAEVPPELSKLDFDTAALARAVEHSQKSANRL
jgi:hypothetical protein